MKLVRVILIILLLVICTLWAASYWKIWWVSSDGLFTLQIWNGGITLGKFDRDASVSYTIRDLSISGFTDVSTYWWPVVWIYTEPEWWSLEVTFWLPTLLLALPVAILASSWARRRRRAKQGLCIRCGYDLCGIDHNICPECGERVDHTARYKKTLS